MSGFPTLKSSWPWPWPWIGSYCIPSYITIDFYPHAKCHWNRRNVLWTDRRTTETGFIRSTLSKSRPKKQTKKSIKIPWRVFSYLLNKWIFKYSVAAVANSYTDVFCIHITALSMPSWRHSLSEATHFANGTVLATIWPKKCYHVHVHNFAKW